MTPAIINDKHHTNYINRHKSLISVLLAAVALFGFMNLKAIDKTWTIVIDAGHGGKDPGALGSFAKEKDITLNIALKTGDYIEKNISNVKVLYTRKTDTFLDIKERAEFANRNKADLFISIHANWAKYSSIRGTETFVMGLAKDQENLEVAMKENEVILLEDNYTTKYEGFDPKSPESYIVFTLMQNIFLEQSTNLASYIQQQYKDRIKRTDRGVKQAGFWVLFMTTMPSVLTETGFITNPDEEKFLSSSQGQDYIASAIYRACRNYIEEINKKSGISTAVRTDTIATVDTLAISAKESPGIKFTVQITTSVKPKEVKPENFKGLSDVSEILVNKIYKYTSGRFDEYSEALAYRKKILSLFPDAFIVGIKDNNILPLQEALKLKRNQ
ncbi:MAG: N-acetylmuramoyl-L-alanine amidase [Bacteroidales bacterium]|nr:N-acetylmuramoyl-L-alanine amidase [Bacteroidales bacterium]